MKSKKFKVGSVWTSVLVAGLLVGLAPQPAEAAISTFAYDPTNTQVYFQFGGTAFDAWRVIVKIPAGAVVGVAGGHPHYGFGVSGVINGLTPATNYRIILKIRWVHGGPWVVARNIPFTTNP